VISNHQSHTAASPRAVAIGLGCMRGTSLATLVEGIEWAMVDLGAVLVMAVGTIDRKRDEPALRQFSASRGWPLCFFSAAELDAVRVARPSPALAGLTGTGAVAEPAALLALAARPAASGFGSDRDPRQPPSDPSLIRSGQPAPDAGLPRGRLLVEKRRYQGADGKWVTVAVAAW
jgi:cobalt-precorrin 5A hydrolase